MNSFLAVLLQAAPSQKWLFQSEKINTVLAVILVIWVGIVVYLFLMHRKVSKVEQEIQRLKAGQPASRPQGKNERYEDD